MNTYINVDAIQDGSIPVEKIKNLDIGTVVDDKIAALVDSAPTTLNTLNELAAALGDDPNFATTVATNIGKIDAKFADYLSLSGGTITGNGANLLAVNRQDGNPVIEFGYNDSLMGKYGFDTDGTPIGVVAGSQVTLIHSGNIGSQIVEGITTHTDDAKNANGDIAKLNSYYSSKGFRISRFNGLNGLGIANSDGLIVNWPLDHSYGQQWYMDDESHTIQVRYVANAVWSDWKTIAFTDSNVASATKLATARTIWGQSFDGTGDVNGDAYISTRLAVGNSSTLSPNYTLYVGGNGKIKASTKSGIDTTTIKNSAIFELSGSKEDALFIGQQSNSDMWMQAAYQGTTLYPSQNHTYNLLLQPLGGNVGIGTTDPKYTLDVNGQLSTPYYLSFRNASDSEFSYIGRGGSAATLTIMTYGAENPLNFGTNNKTRMYINGDGNVTIGSSDTASSEYKLDIVGKARVSDELIVTNPTGIRWAYGDYGTLFRNDGQNFYILFTDSGGALTGSWNSLRPFRISLTTGDVTMEHNLNVNGIIKSSSIICGTSRLRVNSPTHGGVFGFMDAQLFGTTTNVSSVHIGSCFGGATALDNTTESPNGVNMTAISIYRGRVGIGKRWGDTELRALHDANCSLGVLNNAHIMGNLAVSSLYSDNGQSGAAGVVLRNEGGIEITHASTPYIDFHHAADTTDFSMRLITRSDKILSFSCSNGAFCPYTNGNESLGASSYRGNILWASGINVTGNTDVGGALTVGAGATFNGDARINGNLVVTGNTASGNSSLTIGTIVLTDENGTLKIAGNAYTTGQLGAREAGQPTSGGGSAILDYDSIVDALGFAPASSSQLTTLTNMVATLERKQQWELDSNGVAFTTDAGMVVPLGTPHILGLDDSGRCNLTVGDNSYATKLYGSSILANDSEVLTKANTSFTRSYTSGTKIGTIKIGGTSTDIYAPASGSSGLWTTEYCMDTGTNVLIPSRDYIGTNTIVGWDLAGSCLNDLYIGYDGYTIWMQGSVDEASDMRLKTVIDAVNLDIRDIAYAPIFNYVFKSRPQGRQMLGSSAQYWQPIAPCAVSENDKGNLAMNYGAIALASVVAVAKKTLTHEEEIAELKLKVQSLENRLARYELN